MGGEEDGGLGGEAKGEVVFCGKNGLGCRLRGECLLLRYVRFFFKGGVGIGGIGVLSLGDEVEERGGKGGEWGPKRRIRKIFLPRF